MSEIMMSSLCTERVGAHEHIEGAEILPGEIQSLEFSWHFLYVCLL